MDVSLKSLNKLKQDRVSSNNSNHMSNRLQTKHKSQNRDHNHEVRANTTTTSTTTNSTMPFNSHSNVHDTRQPHPHQPKQRSHSSSFKPGKTQIMIPSPNTYLNSQKQQKQKQNLQQRASSRSHSNSPNRHRRQQQIQKNQNQSQLQHQQVRSSQMPNTKKTLPLNFIDCSQEDMLTIISRMLTSLIEINDKQTSTNLSYLKHDTLTRFHSRSPPQISVFQYLSRLAHYSSLENSVLITAVYYIDLLTLCYPTFAINSLTVHRFLLTATTVVGKALCDSFCSNTHYAKVGGVNVMELNLLEAEFLNKVGFRVVPRDFSYDSIVKDRKPSTSGGSAFNDSTIDIFKENKLGISCAADVLDLYYKRMIALVGGELPPPGSTQLHANKVNIGFNDEIVFHIELRTISNNNNIINNNNETTNSTTRLRDRPITQPSISAEQQHQQQSSHIDSQPMYPGTSSEQVIDTSDGDLLSSSSSSISDTGSPLFATSDIPNDSMGTTTSTSAMTTTTSSMPCGPRSSPSNFMESRGNAITTTISPVMKHSEDNRGRTHRSLNDITSSIGSMSTLQQQHQQQQQQQSQQPLSSSSTTTMSAITTTGNQRIQQRQLQQRQEQSYHHHHLTHAEVIQQSQIASPPPQPIPIPVPVHFSHSSAPIPMPLHAQVSFLLQVQQQRLQ
ncbi:unnamed protein product [Ambrosiozyma monospora]|uniref:Unnamed protein product n=1 Tax=Ambrosiozyma monospora TaxID=43982 RepID=A0A9W7DIB7_AMBMO|nr:unnamed protein product [Ambrosiozyma monospora]